MPWSHCDLPFILDDETCPVCGQDKGQWTVQVEKTRTLVIGAPKKKRPAFIDIELRDARGALRPGRPYRAELANGRVKTGTLDARAHARIEQLHPGPCKVTFPEDPLEGGARYELARPLADLVRASPAPIASWRLQRVAAVEGPLGQGRVADVVLGAPAAVLPLVAPPPRRAFGAARAPGHLTAARPLLVGPLSARAEPVRLVPERPAGPEAAPAGAPAKLEADLPLRVTFPCAEAAQAWLLASPLQVHVDGERAPCGAYVAAADRVMVQFRVEPGSHHVLVSTTTRARGATLRTLLLSQRIEVEPRAAPAPPAAGAGPAGPAADPAAATPAAPTGAPRPLAAPGPLVTGHASPGPLATHTAPGPLAAGHAAAAPGPLATGQAAPGRAATPAAATPAAATPAAGSTRPARGVPTAPLGGAPGPFEACAAHLGRPLVARELAPEPIVLTPAQLEAGAGEWYVFQPEPVTLKAELPLAVSFPSAAEAQRWLLASPLQVHVDGKRVPCGAFVESARLVRVQFRVEPGEHAVLVSTRASVRGSTLRTLLLSQRLTVESSEEAAQATAAAATPTVEAASPAPAPGGPAPLGRFARWSE